MLKALLQAVLPPVISALGDWLIVLIKSKKIPTIEPKQDIKVS
jgi:hypothetical protein